MKYKKGMYLLDKSDGEIIKLLERVAIYPDIKIEKWRFKLVKTPYKYPPGNKYRYLGTGSKSKKWKQLTKIDLILLGVKT